MEIQSRIQNCLNGFFAAEKDLIPDLNIHNDSTSSPRCMHSIAYNRKLESLIYSFVITSS